MQIEKTSLVIVIQRFFLSHNKKGNIYMQEDPNSAPQCLYFKMVIIVAFTSEDYGENHIN